MTQVPATFTRDANHVPITNLGLTTSKAITYVGGTTGATGATTLFTVTGGKELFTIPLAGKNDRSFQNITDYKIILSPGETITLAGTSANSATIKGTLLWKELF